MFCNRVPDARHNYGDNGDKDSMNINSDSDSDNN